MNQASETVLISELMTQSGVKFGTSGARGLVSQMTDRVCYAYARAFLQYLSRSPHGGAAHVYLAGDRRPSTPRILRAIALAAAHHGTEPVYCGLIPSPAVALAGLRNHSPAIMVTGSHIPDDRNGIKFNTSRGEITKTDEAGIRSCQVTLEAIFQPDGSFLPEHAKAAEAALGSEHSAALSAYKARYTDSFPADCLKGLTVGVYGHSAVGRDFLVELYETLGAKVIHLGFSETFIPVDTEAIREEDVALALGWANEHGLDAIVSTDGDSDRPLISDELGRFIRGDVSGIVTAQFLSADGIALPVSCNSALERTILGAHIVRTQIGSPYVIAGMEEALEKGSSRIVGYEANGGFLTLTDLPVLGRVLPALPTRDAVIVHLALLVSAKQYGVKLSELLSRLPARFTESGRDQSFSQARSSALMEMLVSSPASFESLLQLGCIEDLNQTDGLRMTFESGEVVHLRPSGNAPELRCYAEADTGERARSLVELGLKAAAQLVPAV